MRTLLLAVAARASGPGFVSSQGRPATIVDVDDDVRVAAVKRLEINIGSHSQWGASQLLKNLVINLGFEAGSFGMASHAANGATSSRFPRGFWDPAWNNNTYGIGQQPGSWDGRRP